MLILTLLLLSVTFLAPPLLLFSASPVAMLCGAAAWLGMCVAFLPCVRRYDCPWLTALLLPGICLFYAAATAASALLYWRGRGGAWKGRFQAAAR